MAVNPITSESLTIDYKSLMRIPIGNRVGGAATSSEFAQAIMSSLTPSQIAQAFPDYYRRQLPDISNFITSNIQSKLSGRGQSWNQTGGGSQGYTTHGYDGPATLDPDARPGAPVKKGPPKITAGEFRAVESNPYLAGYVDKTQRKITGKYATDELEPNNRRSLIKNTYLAFRNQGFSDKQARALVAEVGRENSFVAGTLFGEHPEPGNKHKGRTNAGFLSWADTRRTAFLEFMQSKGLLSEDGKTFSQTQDSLNAMAEYVKLEMSGDATAPISGGQLKAAKAFLDNPDLDQQEAGRVLAGYIGWDIAGAHHDAGKAIVRRDTHYEEINKILREDTITEETAVPAEQPNAEEVVGRVAGEIQGINFVSADAIIDTSTESYGNVIERQEEVAGVRKGKIQNDLKKSLSYAAEQAGDDQYKIEIVVTSGGQRMEEAPGATGSHRHDEGGAADFNGYLVDRKTNERIPLDPRKEEHIPYIKKMTTEFSRVHKNAGVGALYMDDPTKIHFGGDDVSEHGGRARGPLAYAGPEWFKNAHAEGIRLRTEDLKNDRNVLREWEEKKLAAFKEKEKQQDIDVTAVPESSIESSPDFPYEDTPNSIRYGYLSDNEFEEYKQLEEKRLQGINSEEENAVLDKKLQQLNDKAVNQAASSEKYSNKSVKDLQKDFGDTSEQIDALWQYNAELGTSELKDRNYQQKNKELVTKKEELHFMINKKRLDEEKKTAQASVEQKFLGGNMYGVNEDLTIMDTKTGVPIAQVNNNERLIKQGSALQVTSASKLKADELNDMYDMSDRMTEIETGMEEQSQTQARQVPIPRVENKMMDEDKRWQETVANAQYEQGTQNRAFARVKFLPEGYHHAGYSVPSSRTS